MRKKIFLISTIMFCLLISVWAHPKFTQPIGSNFEQRQSERADSLHGFDVQKYVITLTINDATHYISGDVVANVTATADLAAIDYNLVGLNVTQVYVNDAVNTYTVSNGLVHIPLTGITNGTAFTTKVVYSGTPTHSPDVYQIGMIFNTSMVFTLSDPDASRYWWPCYDHPWDKAVVDLHITMRSDWLVACNGIRESIVDNGNGTKTHNWLGSNPMIPYLACVTAANYREINQTYGNIPIQNFVLNSQYNNAVTDFSDLPEMMSVLSEKYGPYPFEKYGNATVSMQTFGAMEHQTMTTMGSSYITGTHAGQYTILHELAHSWYGNCVSPLSFKDVWLSEGFATYSEAVWEESQHGFSSMTNYIQSNFHNYYMNWESVSNPYTIYNPGFNDYFSPPSYEKAASVLHMLRLQVGDTNFWNIMRNWVIQHHNGNAITAEFEDLCESISGQDLHQFFQQWIYHGGIPSIRYSYFYYTDTTNNELHLKVFAKTTCESGGDFYVKFPIQVVHPNHTDSLLVDAVPVINAPVDQIIPFSANDSIILNADPHHWLLQRGLVPVYPSQPQAFAANNCVFLTWEPYWSEVPVTNYQIYRTDENLVTSLVGEVPDNTFQFLDSTAQNGVTYYYRIKAGISGEFTSDYSMETSATPTAFAMNQGVLVIDETRDGTGSAISPTDAMVDGFYNDVLIDVQHTNYDFNSSGAPTLDLLSQYSTVIYHDDDFSSHSIQNITNVLGSYVIGGGNLIISGWKTAAQLPTSFLDIFFPGIQVNYVANADLVSVQSNIYPDLLLDPTKLSTTWNGHLSMVDTFSFVTNPIFIGEFIENSPNQGQALGIRTQQNGEFVLLGFPLYVMMADGVREFLHQFLQETDPSVPVSDQTLTPAVVSLSVYPNPFSRNATIRYTIPKSEQTEIAIYNVRGQKVKTFYTKDSKAGENTVQWNGTDDNDRNVGNGIYFCKMKTGDKILTRKMLMMQ